MSALSVAWLWIPITVFAALAQTLRNAAQRHLIAELGTLGATLIRFLYGLPFALIWLAAILLLSGATLPAPTPAFALWVSAGAVGQLVATALLLRVMAERNFALGVAYSKTEIVQVALFGLVMLGDPLLGSTAAAIALATAGVIMLSPATGTHPLRDLLVGWTSRTALLGLGSGASFAISAVGYRGAALALDPTAPVVAAALALVCAQTLQTVLLGGWLVVRDPLFVRQLAKSWRMSLAGGLMGTLASIGWFTAMAMEPVAHVRTLGLVELLFSYVVSRRLFREHLRPVEIAGMALLVLGLVVIVQVR
ncbi:MAG TPA: DMT family transporter [Alphaproteobacteria bacterium]